jgi:hypothetical protein
MHTYPWPGHFKVTDHLENIRGVLEVSNIEKKLRKLRSRL